MSNQRGLSIVELLIAAMAGTLVVGGLLSFYLATTRSFNESSTQAALQRQGSLALQEIARKVRNAVEPNAIAKVTCNGVADSVQVTTPPKDARANELPAKEPPPNDVVCYYATADALCEFRPPQAPGDVGQCRNLLTGGLKSVVLVMQKTRAEIVVDPRCPPVVVDAGAPYFAMTPNCVNPSTQVDVAFAIRDTDGGPEGVNAMSFATSLTCSGRNC